MSNFILTRQAEADVDGIVDYIWEDGPNSALNFVDEIERVCTLLGDVPHIGTKISFITSREYFMFPAGKFSSYLIIYAVEDKTPVIIRILHGRRDIETILEDD